MRKRLIVMSVLFATMPVPALATTVFTEDFTCPIGGEKFQDTVIGSYSSWGSRPDGRPYGTLPWVPLPECPGNGFPLFREDFTPQDIAVLAPLVESVEYQQMRTAETQHYRLWWLMRALPDADPALLASTLLVASWQADDEPARKARYQRAFISAAEALPTDDPYWFLYNLRAANAHRELGAFDTASARLAVLNDARNSWPQETEERTWAEQMMVGLAKLTAERNTTAEPTSLVPPREAVARCIGQESSLSLSEQEACGGAAISEAIAEHREWEQATASQ